MHEILRHTALAWILALHPICEASRATYVVPVAGIPSNLGLLLNETYCAGSMQLRTFDCGGW